jgi:hypothetical protein
MVDGESWGNLLLPRLDQQRSQPAVYQLHLVQDLLFSYYLLLQCKSCIQKLSKKNVPSTGVYNLNLRRKEKEEKDSRTHLTFWKNGSWCYIKMCWIKMCWIKMIEVCFVHNVFLCPTALSFLSFGGCVRTLGPGFRRP